MVIMRNPANPDQAICKYMRTKASYVPDLQDPVYLEREDPYHQYFCLKTLHNIGPDDDVVCPEECTRKRICFEPMSTVLA